MMRSWIVATVALPALMVGCSSDPAESPPAEDAGAPPIDAEVVIDAATNDVAQAPDAPAALDLNAVLARLAGCTELTQGRYKTDADPGLVADIPICGLKNAVFWKADMDIDCDGKMSAICNKSTDSAFQAQTAATDSTGAPLDAATLPYVVVPSPSTRFDYRAHGLALGSVVLVAYKGRFEFGVIGDLGPTAIIGEASYAMATKLGIPPSPSSGGVDTGVTYVAFTGKTGLVGTMEDHAEAVRVGDLRARQFLSEN